LLSDKNFLYNDIAANEDSLGFKTYVDAIAEFLTSEYTLPPITLSIEGPWGCGKSSFMKQLKKVIDDKDKTKKNKKFYTVWFDCWKYEKEDELWASFALNFMDELSKNLSWKRRQYSKLKLLYLRYKLRMRSNFLIFIHLSWKISSSIVLFSLLSLAAFYALNYLGMLPNFVDVELVKRIAQIILILTPLVGFIKLFSAENWFMDLFRDPFGLKQLESHTNYKELIPFKEHFFSDFNKIIESYVGESNVYVFIDELDRCKIPKAAELMQTLIFMALESPHVYFSLAFDRKIMAAELASINKEVIEYLDIEGLEYGYDFIEKFIQLPFKVPAPKIKELSTFLTLLNESEFNSNSSGSVEEFNKSKDITTIGSSKEESKSLNKNEVKETEIDDYQNTAAGSNKSNVVRVIDCYEDINISKKVIEMIAPAMDNNPRRIKQFINLFRFQKFIGEKTGLFDYIESTDPKQRWNCKKLAKYVAISINWPSLVSALSLNIKLLEQLQDYCLDQGHQSQKKVIGLDKWIKDERLITLLNRGCWEGNDISKNVDQYTLSGLDFSKLLEISPIVTPPDSMLEIISNMEFVRISPGEFKMGSPSNEQGRHNSEDHVRKVTIRNPFCLGKYPVTQKQWITVMGYNPSQFKGEEMPVVNISWNDALEFIRKLNQIEGTDKYRLPSEAEWEYACRAGTTTRYFFGDDESKLWDYAWYIGNSDFGTHPVGQKKPNPLDLYDMNGNVWEWCQDNYHDSYSGAPSNGIAWEDGSSSNCVIRGGGWFHDASYCRSAARFSYASGSGSGSLGFRIVRKI
jgi:formylglycine-generating enzyme required for sulfatase activity